VEKEKTRRRQEKEEKKKRRGGGREGEGENTYKEKKIQGEKNMYKIYMYNHIYIYACI